MTDGPLSASDTTKCNICGSGEFLPGPNGRMARSGKLPCCAGCASLERHRGLRALLSPLPREFFATRRAVQFAPERAPDRALDPAWFAEFEEYIVPSPAIPSIAQTPAADHSADFISFSHLLEFEADDQAAFAELCRIASPTAVLNIAFTSSMQSATTTGFDPPKPPYGRHWEYGRDIVTRFALAERGLRGMVVTMHDPVTETSEQTHFFCRRDGDYEFLERAFKGRTEIISI